MAKTSVVQCTGGTGPRYRFRGIIPLRGSSTRRASLLLVCASKHEVPLTSAQLSQTSASDKCVKLSFGASKISAPSASDDCIRYIGS